MEDNNCTIVDILGQKYKIRLKDVTDPQLEDSDGYCDFTSKEIAIRSDIRETTHTVSNLQEYKEKVLRHEIIHAFLYESGLAYNSWGCNEEIVDWIAIQFDKLVRAIDSSVRALKQK